jgi:hypothetical protein
MLAPTDEHRRVARICFWVSGVAFWSTGVLWGASAMETPMITKISVAALIGAISAAGAVWATSVAQTPRSSGAETSTLPSVSCENHVGGTNSGSMSNSCGNK